MRLLQIVDVVRSKVREIAVRTWRRPNIEHITLYRAFNRLFNRMTSNRGQGLWDCLVNDGSVHRHHHHQRSRKFIFRKGMLGCLRLFLFPLFSLASFSFIPTSPSSVA